MLPYEDDGASGEAGGMIGESLACGAQRRPSIGRCVLTFSPEQDRNAPELPGLPAGGVTACGSYTSKATLCS
jgi:hypothetical protein